MRSPCTTTIQKTLFNVCTIFLVMTAGCRLAEPPPPLQWEGERSGTVDNGIYNDSYCKWLLPDNGNGCKLITSHSANEAEINLLNGRAGTTETLIITRLPQKISANDTLLRSSASNELTGLQTQYPELKTTGLQPFIADGINGYYFGCRTDGVEMGLVVFLTRSPASLCSYSFARIQPGNNNTDWPTLQQMTAEGLRAITVHDLANTIFASGR